MGAWGPGLYQDDIAEDVRDYYKDQLHRGKSGAEITQELLKRNDLSDDLDDEPIFWFALADTQWNLGRLEDFVKKQALYHIHQGCDIKRWEEESPKEAKIRAKVLSDLEQKLLSPQPAEKKISQYRLYHCKWNMGDTFAYQLESDMAKEKGLLGRYILLQKVDERVWHPGHTVPIVYIKITDGKNLPLNLEEYNRMEYVQISFTKYEDRFLPIDGRRPREDIAEKSRLNYEVDEFGLLPQYRVILLTTSKRSIPSKLIYLGNFAEAVCPSKEFIPHSEFNISFVQWREFETAIISRYFGHNHREFQIYSKSNPNND